MAPCPHFPIAWLCTTPPSPCCVPVTDRPVLSAPLGPLPGAKDTEPPAQGPSCSRTRARIDFQMSRKSKQTKALHYLQSSLELSVMGTHREELCRRQSCSLPACIPIPSLVGDSTQTCSELEPKAWRGAEHREQGGKREPHVPRGKDFSRQGQRRAFLTPWEKLKSCGCPDGSRGIAPVFLSEEMWISLPMGEPLAGDGHSHVRHKSEGEVA